MSTLARLARLLTACTVLRIDPLAVHIEAGDSGRHEVRLATCADWYDLASHWKVPIRKRDIRHHRVAPRAPGARYVYVLSGRAGVLYVGQSLNPAQRLLDHRKNPRLRQTTFLSLFRPESPGVFYDSPDAEIAELERCAIADLVPAVNRERITPTRDIGAPWEAIQRDAERRIGNENRRGL